MTTTAEAPKKRGRRKTVQSRGLCQRTFKKKDGTTYVGEIWYMRYSAPDPDHPGKSKMVFESTGKTNKAEANEELVKRKAMVFEDRHPDLKRANENTFERFVIDDYLPYCKDQKDIKNKTNMCINQFIPVFGRFLLKISRQEWLPTISNQRKLKVIKYMAKRRTRVVRQQLATGTSQVLNIYSQLLPSRNLKSSEKTRYLKSKVLT
jgi:hypothetical protein